MIVPFYYQDDRRKKWCAVELHTIEQLLFDQEYDPHRRTRRAELRPASHEVRGRGLTMYLLLWNATIS
ncbi:MAG: hypothetical protein ABI779_24300 [Acidobacteriota bacterium]